MKHSKLFLTGMAALLLSFGLMMTGCDSGGDSDSDSGGGDGSLSASVTVAAGNNALAIAITGGALADGISAYINTDGTKILLAATDPASGYGTGMPVSSSGTILAKGLSVVASSPSAGELLAGSVTITVPAADKGDATGLNATAGTAATIPDATYTVDVGNSADDSGEIALLADNKLKIYGSTTYDGSGADAVIDTTFDADIIAVLGALVDTDTVTFANGAITAATFTAAPDAAAKLQAVLNYAGETTLAAADNTGLASFTVPTGKTLVVTGAAFGTAANAVVTVDGTLAVGDGTNDAILSNAVFTTAAAPNAILGVGTSGTITLAAGDTLALANGGTVTSVGTGTLALPNSTFAEGVYTATGTVTINAITAGDTIVTGTTAGDGLVMTGAVSLLTQGTTAATYTLKATNDGLAFVTFGGASAAATKVVIPKDGTGTRGAVIEGSATASIVLGAGTIELTGEASAVAKRGYLDLAAGAKIGVFTLATAGTTNEVVTAVGDCVVTTNKKAGSLASGTITAGTGGLRLEGKNDDASNGLIKADLTTVTTNS
jgi:hypothetical protein